MALRNLASPGSAPRLGLRANLAQFSLLVAVNGLVGALVGQERTLVPLLGTRVFGLRSAGAVVAFIATFGLAKAAADLVAGALADRIGRRRVLIIGWLIGLPVPFGLMVAPEWGWIVALNLLLGVNQGLTWSTTVIMKIDLAGPRRRGLAMGLNEFAGYLAVAASAAASGALAARYGLRPEPFFLGVAIAASGLAASVLFVRDTAGHVRLERGHDPAPSFREVAALASYKHRALAAVSRTGLINNANDAFAWGLLPVILAREGLDTTRIGLVAGTYPAVWAAAQLLTGPLSDRIGRRIPIAVGMAVQAVALASFLVGHGTGPRVAAATLLGLGTALTYPALLAAVADDARPSWRASALGVYRTWRDLGYVAGALISGVAASLLGVDGAVVTIAIVTGISAVDAWTNLARSPSSGRLNTLG